MIEEKKFEDLIYEVKDKVAIITFNRPEKLNSVRAQGMAELYQALKEAEGDDEVGAVILAGKGSSFCAGADFGDTFGTMLEIDYKSWQEQIVQPMIRIYKTITDIPKPVIAAIQGYAVGGGVDIAATCDIRIAAEDTKFAEVFVKNAINPEACNFYMPRLIGLGRALLYSFTSDTITAVEAERIGLVEKVVKNEELMEASMALATRFANGPRQAIAATKKLMHQALETNNLDVTLETSFDSMFRLIKTEDFHEVVNAFAEKRKPVYKGI